MISTEERSRYRSKRSSNNYVERSMRQPSAVIKQRTRSSRDSHYQSTSSRRAQGPSTTSKNSADRPHGHDSRQLQDEASNEAVAQEPEGTSESLGPEGDDSSDESFQVCQDHQCCQTLQANHALTTIPEIFRSSVPSADLKDSDTGIAIAISRDFFTRKESCSMPTMETTPQQELLREELDNLMMNGHEWHKQLRRSRPGLPYQVTDYLQLVEKNLTGLESLKHRGDHPVRTSIRHKSEWAEYISELISSGGASGACIVTDTRSGETTSFQWNEAKSVQWFDSHERSDDGRRRVRGGKAVLKVFSQLHHFVAFFLEVHRKSSDILFEPLEWRQ